MVTAAITFCLVRVSCQMKIKWNVSKTNSRKVGWENTDNVLGQKKKLTCKFEGRWTKLWNGSTAVFHPNFLYAVCHYLNVLLLVETKAQAAVTDTVKHRLEQLDDFEEVWFIWYSVITWWDCMNQGSVKEMLNLSQQEYVKKIDDMNRALCQAWDRDQKVKALKIAIQVCTNMSCV